MIRLRPISLEFVSPSFFGKPLATLVFGLGVITCFFVALGYWESLAAVSELNQQKVSLEKKVGQTSRRMGNTANSHGLSPIESAIHSLHLPWNLLLQEMEDSLDENVALVRFEPDAGHMQVNLTGECRQLSDAVAFVKRLDQTQSLENPTITVYNSRQTTSGLVVEFSIQAAWRKNQ